MTTPMQAETTGTRENLTNSQARALFRLWQRFLRLCEMPAGSLSGGGTPTARAPPSTPTQPDAAARTADVASPHTPSPSSSGEKLAGTGAPLYRAKSYPAATALDPTMPASDPSRANGSGATTKYGKPLQRQSSTVRQIDERGSHIPKDDRVKDELKTLEEAKEMREFLERYGGERLREIFWEMVKGEHPDAVMLRFLRARKWNVDRAIAVIGSTAAFRADNDVTSILRGGELVLTQTRGGMNMLANGISYIYGATPIGEPVYFIEVGNHFSHNQTQQELKRGVIFLQELLQLLMPPPIERKVVIFNMNDFGIRNMDWWCVFFMVKTMESYYVETLSRVYVHGAPWIFKPIWAILKPLLDPVVRDKVRLTFSAEELAEHVPFHHLPKDSMRGGMDWAFSYPPPDKHENDAQLDTETRDRLHAEYMAVAAEFESATLELTSMYAHASLLRRGGHPRAATSRREGSRLHDLSLSSDEEDADTDAVRGAAYARRGSAIDNGPDGTQTPSAATTDDDDGETSLKARRDVLATKVRVCFLRLRPYVVGKSMVDRWGATSDDGRITWQYRSLDGEVEEQVLGEGTTLPELEQNLEMIEQALAPPQAKDGHTTTSVRPTPSSPHIVEAQQSVSKAPTASSPGQAGEMNRRQQRLRNRSRPGSASMDGELAFVTSAAQRQSIDDPRYDTADATTFDGSAHEGASQVPLANPPLTAADDDLPVPVHPLRAAASQPPTTSQP